MEIHYSKAYKYFEFVVSILIIGVSIYFFFKGEPQHYILGVIMTGILQYIGKAKIKVLAFKFTIFVKSNLVNFNYKITPA